VSKWGGLGGKGGCRDGSETGSVGCVCTQGVAPVSVKTGRPLGAAAADQGAQPLSEAVPELVKANAPQPETRRAAAAAAAHPDPHGLGPAAAEGSSDADLDVGDHGPRWIASHGGEPQETAAQAVAAGTHSAQYLCDEYGRQCGAAERERGNRGKPTVRKDSRGKRGKRAEGGCPKSKDCWGADAAEPECIACIESQQQEFIGGLDDTAADEDAELQRELDAAVAAGALPAGAVVAPKGQQQQPQQQQQAFPDLEMPKRSQQQEAALDEFEKRQRQAQQAQAAAAQPAPAAAAAQPAAVLQPPTLTGAAAGEDGAAEAAAAAAGASAGAAGGADMVLPPGTCKATNPAYAASQEQWARWCEKNCVGDKWSSTMASTTDGLKGCVDGSETGEVMCVCTQGVDPIAPGSDAQPAAQAAADSKAAAPSKPKAKPEATTPKAKPKPKPNAKPNAKPNGKKPSAKQQQQQAAAASGKAKGKGCTCSDVYACCDAAEGACTSPTDKSRPYSFCGGTAKSAPACSVSSANCSNSEFSASDKDAYDVRCRDKTFRDTYA